MMMMIKDIYLPKYDNDDIYLPKYDDDDDIYLPKYDDDDKCVGKDSNEPNDRIDDHENQLDRALDQIEQLFQIK